MNYTEVTTPAGNFFSTVKDEDGEHVQQEIDAVNDLIARGYRVVSSGIDDRGTCTRWERKGRRNAE